MRATRPKRLLADGRDPLLTVRLPASLYVSLKAWAKRRGMNRSAAVRSLLELGMAEAVRKSSTAAKPEHNAYAPESPENTKNIDVDQGQR
jgi:hypothetical protein